MSKLSNSLPKLRLHRAIGRAIVTLAGRHHYLGPHNTEASRAEHDRLIAEWMAEFRPTYAPRGQSDFTGNELLAAYLKFASGTTSLAGHVN